MNATDTQTPRAPYRHTSIRPNKLLLAATYGLTSSLIAPTLHAAHCSTPQNYTGIGVYRVKSTLPFVSDRCVLVRKEGGSPATAARSTEPNKPQTTPPGENK